MEKLKIKIKEQHELTDFQKEQMNKLKEELKKFDKVYTTIPYGLGKGKPPK